MLKILLRIWPIFLPVLFYLFWVFIIDKIIKKFSKKSSIIEGEFKVVGKSQTQEKEREAKISAFSLKNRYFVIVLYFSLICAILSLLFLATK